MNKNFLLTKEQKEAVENLAKAIKDCNEKRVTFVTEDASTIYAFNGKHADAVEQHHETMGISSRYVMPICDLISVDIPFYYMPFIDGKIDVCMK